MVLSRPFAVVLASFLLLAAPSVTGAPASSPGAGASVLEGWSDIKFGMKPSQLRALPDQNFGRYNAKNLSDQLLGAMASKKPALINGLAFTFDLHFNSFEALTEIGMWNEKTMPRADCDARFVGLLSQLDRSYGAFLPVYPEQKKDDQAQMPMDIAWKTGEGGSRYQLATVYLNTETASVWDARKFFGSRFLDVSAVWSAPRDDQDSVCLIELDFKA